jgi:hypothetical protein
MTQVVSKALRPEISLVLANMVNGQICATIPIQISAVGAGAPF